MGLDLARLLTPDVIIAVGVAAVIAACLTAAAFMFFVSRTARTGIDAVQATGGKVLDVASTAIEQIAQNGADVLKPIGQGIGEVLGAMAEQVKLKQRDLNELSTEKVALAQEVERLKNRHIDVSEVTAQLKLALLEITQQYDSFDKHQIDKAEGIRVLQAPTVTEYVGVQRATFRSQVGLDLQKLRFAISADGVVLVHGLRDVRVIGVAELKVARLLGEIRQSKLDGSTVTEIQVLVDDRRLVDEVDAHHQKVMAEAQGPQSVQHWAAATAKFGLGFLQACLSSAGVQLMESDQPLENGMGFVELCRLLNEQLALRLDTLQVQQRLNDEKALALQKEVVQVIEGGAT